MWMPSVMLLIFGISTLGNAKDKEPFVIYKSTRYYFTPCGASGRFGPDQAQCNYKYGTSVNASSHIKARVRVEVKIPEDMKGVQIWTVPKTAVYRTLVYGANGGYGSQTQEQFGNIVDKFFLDGRGEASPTWPSLVRGYVNLTQGSEVYIIVGQAGGWACGKKTSPFCSTRPAPDQRNSYIGGGGGGGGASIIAVKEPGETEPKLLIISGGGGGMGRIDIFDGEPEPKETLIDCINNGSCPEIDGPRPGFGGSFDRNASRIQRNTQQDGDWMNFFNMTLKGGRGCTEGQSSGFDSFGGWGGGGGACTAGGGGGGYHGGAVSLTDNEGVPGGLGSSYYDAELLQRPAIVAHRSFQLGGPHGWAELTEVPPMCPNCEHGRCMWLDIEYIKYQCTACVEGYNQTEDKLSCEIIVTDEVLVPQVFPSMDGASEPSEPIQSTVAIVFVTIISVVLIALFGVTIWCTRCFRICRENRIRKVSTTSSSLLNHPGQVVCPKMMPDTQNPLYSYDGVRPHRISADHISVFEKLGEGEFSDVYKAKLSESDEWDGTEIDVALKIPKPGQVDSGEEFIAEAVIISSFDHKNIIKILGLCEDAPFNCGREMAIVMELLLGGDLKTFLTTNRPTQTEAFSELNLGDCISIAGDVASGCKYLEDRKYIHRDIAARNILLTKYGNGRVAKISDFGRSRDIAGGEYITKVLYRKKPVKWLPPEGITDSAQTTKSDVWSFGILLWEIFTMGESPYPGLGNEEASESIRAGLRMEPPGMAPTAIADVMRQCWIYHAEDRPSFSHIVQVLTSIIKDKPLMGQPILRNMLTFERSLRRSALSSLSSTISDDSLASPGMLSSIPLLSYRQEQRHTDAA